MVNTTELIGGAPAEQGIPIPQLEIAEETDTYARLVAEPLREGFGITLGNALRRVLLSSLEGAAITSVRIEGIEHEFSVIPGVQEDTTEFLLNLKGVRLRALADRPGTLTLEASGAGVVRAGDIQVPADFDIVNPDLYLATLNDDSAHLMIEMHAETGSGYRPAGSTEGVPIGVIPVDAIFSPVRKANFRVEKTRVGQQTNFDRLVLDVWTDGTLRPTDAVAMASDTLIAEFQLFSHMGQPPVPQIDRGVGAGMALPPDRYNTPIEELNLSVRAYNCLKRSGLMTVGQILEKSEDELLSLRNFGRKSYDELRDKLVDMGYVEPDAEGLKPIIPEATGIQPGGNRPTTIRTSSVILDEEDEDESLSTLGKALKEALREVGEEELLGADEEE